jgi:hypothetical protein
MSEANERKTIIIVLRRNNEHSRYQRQLLRGEVLASGRKMPREVLKTISRKALNLSSVLPKRSELIADRKGQIIYFK